MVYTWDAAFEASPADSDEIKYGAGKIRDLKAAISERLTVEHDIDTGKQLPGKSSVVYAGTTAEIAALTGMSAGALAWDTTLSCWKLYSGSAWEAKDPIPSGTKMLFYQDTAPAGWTIQNTLNDKVVYITKGSAAGGQTGGGVHSGGSWTISGLTPLDHAHLGPSHTHTIPVAGWGGLSGTAANGRPCIGVMDLGGLDEGWQGYATSAPPTGAGGDGYTGGATALGISSNGAWRPAAYCCIIAARN